MLNLVGMGLVRVLTVLYPIAFSLNSMKVWSAKVFHFKTQF